jgi:hypothetical protein
LAKGNRGVERGKTPLVNRLNLVPHTKLALKPA